MKEKLLRLNVKGGSLYIQFSRLVMEKSEVKALSSQQWQLMKAVPLFSNFLLSYLHP